jgi:hypothetical protein
VSVTVVALSVDVLTVAAAWIAGLAIVALVLTGWRQPARAQPRTRRGTESLDWTPIEVEHEPGEPYRRPGPLRRLLAGLAGLGITLVTGAVIAIVLAFVLALTVIRLTGLLTQ